jgi:hypothetical protein
MRFLIIAALAAASTFPVQRHDTSDVTLHFAGTGTHTLDLRTIEGSIHVMADRGSDARISIARTVRAETEAAAEQGLREVRVDTEDNAAEIGLTVRDPHRTSCGENSVGRRNDAWWDRPHYAVRVDLDARVPAETRIRLCTINGGEIEVSGVTGDFDVTNVNGRVALDGLGGSGRASTVNGSVTATFVRPPRDASMFHTINGDVTVTFPSNLSADLRLKTFHGGLFTDFDVKPVAEAVRAETDPRSGRTVYRSRQYTVVRAGTGGPELTLDTLNGDVRVLRTR